MADRGREDTAAAAVVGAVAGAVLLATMLFAWAATQGHGQVFAGDGGDRMSVSQPTQTADPQDGEPTRETDRSSDDSGPTHDLSWIGVLVQVLLLGALAALAGRLGWLAWRRVRERERRAREPDADFEVLTAPEAVARDLVAGAGEQLDLLQGGEPRNGIVAAWERFERLATQHGMAPERAETSSEFTLRVLELVEADRGAVQRLAELFREARFSDHPITEDHRHRAAEALSQIHDSLTASGRRPGA